MAISADVLSIAVADTGGGTVTLVSVPSGYKCEPVFIETTLSAADGVSVYLGTNADPNRLIYGIGQTKYTFDAQKNRNPYNFVGGDGEDLEMVVDSTANSRTIVFYHLVSA